LPCQTTIRTRAVIKPLFSDISNVRVFVADLTVAVEFYRDVLGLPLRLHTPEFALFDTGSATLMIEPGGNDPTDGALVGRFTGISLTTADLAAAYAALRDQGVDFLHPPERQPWGTLTHFRDPSGNVLSAVEYVR
jgi:catechol 2,3-dioxygenase-like lactoylglutathione lyase family enzyme